MHDIFPTSAPLCDVIPLFSQVIDHPTFNLFSTKPCPVSYMIILHFRPHSRSANGKFVLPTGYRSLARGRSLSPLHRPFRRAKSPRTSVCPQIQPNLDSCCWGAGNDCDSSFKDTKLVPRKISDWLVISPNVISLLKWSVIMQFCHSGFRLSWHRACNVTTPLKLKIY